MTLNNIQEERYQRNLLVDQFDEKSQQRLLESSVAVVGAGGLGSALLGYLVASGVGQITIIEDDVVSLSNLQRQLLYTTTDIGRPKAETAAIRLSSINPECSISIINQRITSTNSAQFLRNHNIVIDCSDNYATRYVIDDFCASNEIPMIYGTAQNIGGQVSIFNTLGAKRYRDLYPESGIQQDVVGVLSPIVGVIGSIQALECVKLICEIGQPLIGRLLIINGSSMQFQVFDLQ